MECYFADLSVRIQAFGQKYTLTECGSVSDIIYINFINSFSICEYIISVLFTLQSIIIISLYGIGILPME